VTKNNSYTRAEAHFLQGLFSAGLKAPLPRLKLGGFHVKSLRGFHPKSRSLALLGMTNLTAEFDARILAHGTPSLARKLFGAQGLDYVDAGGAGCGQHGRHHRGG
jgi:hypothetical protein